MSLSVCQDSGPHMSVGPLRDEITSGVPTCPESSQCSCVSLTPSCCDLWVYMFCCWWCDSCYLTNVVILLFWQYYINQWKIHQFLQFFIMKLNIRQVFTTLYNKMKDSPNFLYIHIILLIKSPSNFLIYRRDSPNFYTYNSRGGS